jgi:excisionase family DNA binding protein
MSMKIHPDIPTRAVKLLFTPTEAAIALGISRSKLYELLARGALESVSIGTNRRIPADALDDFVSALRAEATSRQIVGRNPAT